MKIGKVSSLLLRVPHLLPLAKEELHAVFNFIEVETDEGLKGHAMAAYPLRHGVRDYINREAAPAIVGMDALRPEEIRTHLLTTTASKQFHGAWACAVSLIDVALWDIKGKAFKQP